MNVMINEYVHENFTIHRSYEHVEIVYEPLDNTEVLHLYGTIYVNGLEGYRFRAASPFLFNVDTTNRSPKMITGTISVYCGVIRLLWERHPGDHFLCVSYEFNGKGNFELVGSNWIQEGF